MVLMNSVPFDPGGCESGNARLGIIAVISLRQPLATATGKVDDEGGGHKAGDRAADLRFEVQNVAQGGPEILHSSYHVPLVYVILVGPVNRTCSSGRGTAGELTGWTLMSASVRINRFMVWTSLLTRFSKTV